MVNLQRLVSLDCRGNFEYFYLTKFMKINVTSTAILKIHELSLGQQILNKRRKISKSSKHSESSLNSIFISSEIIMNLLGYDSKKIPHCFFSFNYFPLCFFFFFDTQSIEIIYDSIITSLFFFFPVHYYHLYFLILFE